MRIAALTFIEVLLVIAIIGVSAAIATPQFRKLFANLELENFSQDIYYLSRYLQGSAVSQGKIYCLNIDEAEVHFQAVYLDEDMLKNIEGRFGRAYKAPAGISVSVQQVGQAGDKGVIYFYPDGSTDKAEINLENKYKNKATLILQGAIGDIKIR